MQPDIFEVLTKHADLLARQSRSTLQLVTKDAHLQISDDLKKAASEIKRMRIAFQRIARNPENVARQTILRDELFVVGR